MTSSHSDTSSILSSDRTFVSSNEIIPHRQQKRRFGSALSGKPGIAKAQRDLVTQAVRQTSSQPLKPKLAPPPDYENFLVKYRTLLENDQCKDLIFFPRDDLTQISESRRHRTAVPSVSETDLREAKSLFTQQCLKQYTGDWSLVQFNYYKYGGDYLTLAKQCPSDELNELTYEIDLIDEQNEDAESPDSSSILDQEQRVIKEGYLFKGPDLTSESSFVNFRTFKKRYCYLRQDFDGGYKLDFYKDKPKGGAGATLAGVKATVYLELCSDVFRSPKRGKFCFELKLTPPSEGVIVGKKHSLTPHVLLAAENETQLEEWLQVVQGILEKIAKIAKKAKSEETTSVASSQASEADSGREDTLETMKAPDYSKFCKESDEELMTSTHLARQNPFAVYSDLEPLSDDNERSAIGDEKIKPPIEKFGIRFLIECKAMTILLPIADGEKMASQVEPFFVTLFLFDARDRGRRLSENFYIDMNPKNVRILLPQNASNVSNGAGTGEEISVIRSTEGDEFRAYGEPEIRGISKGQLWIMDRKALFSVTHPHSEVYLVARIDKVLQGPISSGQEHYLRPDPKTAAKFHKSIGQTCSRLGRYRMPFAWTAKPVFQQFIGGTESAKETISLYRQESDKLSDEDLVKLIGDLKKPEKGSGKLQALAQTSITINVDVSVRTENLPGMVTSGYLPILSKNIDTTGDGPIIFEMQSFPSQDITIADIQSHVSCQNHLFVYPMLLKYDNQRQFSKARNICCWVEFRESDAANATALKCLYGRYSMDSGIFVHRIGSTVTHHQICPQWYDEVKTALPINLHNRHHFLFTFVHVGVESAQKKRDDGKSGNALVSPSENVIGYAWLPLMKNGRIFMEEDVWLQVASSLPEGYLSHEALGLGKGYAGPEIRWVDGGKPLFHVSIRLASTVVTRDINLQTFFNNCQRMKENGTLADAGSPDTTKAPPIRRFTAGDAGVVTSANSATPSHKPTVDDNTHVHELTKALFSVSKKCLIEFLPTILNQLFSVLALAASEQIQLGAVRALVHVVHESCKANKKDTLKSYIKYIFKSPDEQSTTSTHEELAKLGTLLLRPSRTEPTVAAVYVKNIWFFLDIMVKSMCQRLLTTGRIQMTRMERYSAEFQYKIDTFVETLTLYLCQKYKELPDECRAANKSLAYFLRASLSLMDRGFVFGLIYFVCHKLDAMESKTLKQFKIDFLQIICQHEHFLPLNLPIFCGKENSGPYKRNPVHSTSQNGTVSPTGQMDKPDCPRHASLFQRILSFGAGMLNTGGLTNLVMTGLSGQYGANDIPDTTAMDLCHEFILSDDYCNNHYLVGLLLRHIDYAICESRDLRKRLIAILRNLLAKHSYDDRCQGKHQSNVASLYFPLIPLLMEHLNHLELRDIVNSSTPTNNASGATGTGGSRESTSFVNKTGSIAEQVSSSAVSLRHSNSERSVVTGGKGQMLLWDVSVPSTPLALSRTIPPRQDSEGGSSLSTLKAISGTGDSVSSIPIGINADTGKPSDTDVDCGDNKSMITMVPNSQPDSARDRSPIPPATLPQMLSQTEAFLAYSRFDDNEIKDLLICAVYILKNVNEDALKWFWRQCDGQGLMEFLRLLDLLLFHFKYQGKQRIMKLTWNKLRSSNRTLTLSSSSSMKSGDIGKRLTLGLSQEQCKPARDSTILESPYSVLQEAHLAQEVSLVVLDCLAAFVCTQKSLMSISPRSEFLEKICEMYYNMQSRQSSADVIRQVIASLKLLVKNYSSAFLEGPTNLCNDLCRKLLECCNSSISLVQADSCNLLYLLMRMNYEHTGKKNFSRVHQQIIISLSQLLGDGVNLNNPTFNRALVILNGFAGSDRYHARFTNEVKEVVRRQRTVLMATSQLKEHSDDPDMLADLQKSLADSYAQSPRLRETWLQNLARLHIKRQHFAEAAQCFLHIAAVTAEVLKNTGFLKTGADQFACISNNIMSEEVLDASQPQSDNNDGLGYDLDTFISRVIQCAELMSKADRFEAMGPLYRCVTPILEQMRDYEALTDAYATLHEAYEKATRVNRSGRRVLGTYFRVRFYGQMHFEQEHGKDYLYREPKYTPLAEFTERLSQQYACKFGGADLIGLISDSNPVQVGSLDPKLAYIQVTHVEPYNLDNPNGDGGENSERHWGMGEYEKHTNVDRFYYDTPFTVDGRPGRASTVIDQCKRRIVIATTPRSFPYVVRRLPIMGEKIIQMVPLEAAIDELQMKTRELKIILDLTPVDCKRLQLRLQGAVQPTVNAGPLAYAEAFCSATEMAKYGTTDISRLCETYREFLRVCWEALEVNDRLISPDQFEYQQSLLHYFRDTVQRLNVLFGQQMMPFPNEPVSNEMSNEKDQRRSQRRHSNKRASTIFVSPSNDTGS